MENPWIRHFYTPLMHTRANWLLEKRQNVVILESYEMINGEFPSFSTLPYVICPNRLFNTLVVIICPKHSKVSITEILKFLSWIRTWAL